MSVLLFSEMMAMISLPPMLRYFLLCRDYLIDPQHANEASIVRLVHAIQSNEIPPFPLIVDELCAFAALSDCRGSGEFEVTVVEADSGDTVHQMGAMAVDFGSDPLLVYGLPIRLRHCVFPRRGLYWVKLWYNGREIAQQDFLVR